MPQKPRRPCRYPGCPGFCEQGQVFCKDHIEWSSDRLRGGADPIVCRWYPEKTKIDDQDGMMPDYFTYQSEQIDISSNAIDIEVLVSMFSK